MHDGLVDTRCANPVLCSENHLRRLLARKGVVDLLPQGHPVRRLDQSSSAEESLRRSAPQHGVDDGEKVDLLQRLWRRRRYNTNRLVVIVMTMMVHLVIIVVNLLQLPEQHGRGDDTVQKLVIRRPVVEPSQGRDALEHVLDGRVRV